MGVVGLKAPRRNVAWIVGLVIVIVVALTVGVVVGRSSSSDAATVTLEPAGSASTDAFTSSVTTGPVADFADSVDTASAQMLDSLDTDPKSNTRVVVGTTPGLYGGSGDTRVCDPQMLVDFLAHDASKAAAWASVFGIDPDGISAYVASLTPVLLTHDTLVTNHGYNNGKATARASVLQRGTAVLVDSTGTPRVKCNCGNPLAPPPEAISLTDARLNGEQWPDYAPVAVTVVQTGDTTTNLVLINVHTGDTYNQPVSSPDEGGTGQWVAAQLGPDANPTETTIETSSDGSTWTTQGVVSGEIIRGLTWGGGKWTAVSSGGSSGGTHVLQSTDLRTWNQVGTLADSLQSIAYANGRWVAGGVHPNPGPLETSIVHMTGVIYSSTDASTWTQVATMDQQDAGRQSVAYGNGAWLAVSTEDDYSAPVPFPALEMLASADGTNWSPNGGKVPDSFNDSLAFGGGQWALGSEPENDSSKLHLSRDGVTWSGVAGPGDPNSSFSALAYGDGRFLAANQEMSAAVSTTFVTSSDGTSWSPAGHLDANVSALAFGGSALFGSRRDLDHHNVRRREQRGRAVYERGRPSGCGDPDRHTEV